MSEEKDGTQQPVDFMVQPLSDEELDAVSGGTQTVTCNTGTACNTGTVAT
jgi:bacteriocin-like protein